MQIGAIPPEVERFLLGHIETIPHLEALLLLFQSSALLWSVAEVAARIYVNDKRAAVVLEDLARSGVVAQVEEHPPRYQFIAQSREHAELLDKLVHAYRTQLVGITKLIHSKSSGPVQDFARAFRLKDQE